MDCSPKASYEVLYFDNYQYVLWPYVLWPYFDNFSTGYYTVYIALNSVKELIMQG